MSLKSMHGQSFDRWSLTTAWTLCCGAQYTYKLTVKSGEEWLSIDNRAPRGLDNAAGRLFREGQESGSDISETETLLKTLYQ